MKLRPVLAIILLEGCLQGSSEEVSKIIIFSHSHSAQTTLGSNPRTSSQSTSFWATCNPRGCTCLSGMYKITFSNAVAHLAIPKAVSISDRLRTALKMCSYYRPNFIYSLIYIRCGKKKLFRSAPYSFVNMLKIKYYTYL